MTIFKRFTYITGLCFALVSCNRNIPEFSITPEPETTTENKWWILTHKNYQDPGIFLYNETTASIELELKLPDDLESPHALDFDGTSLWVGGNGENESLYQLNPETGEILSEIKNINTEGIAVQGDYIFYSNLNAINKIEKNGTFVESFETQNTTLNISDIAINDNSLYYLRYSETDPVIKVNLTSKSESPVGNIETSGTYCLAFFENKFITVSALNEITYHSSLTGVISIHTTGIEGWITAIAPYYELEETEDD